MYKIFLKLLTLNFNIAKLMLSNIERKCLPPTSRRNIKGWDEKDIIE